MKTNRLYTSILLLLPSLALSMGLGDMNVTSFLNQQFHAEIPLLDVGSVPLSGIRVTLASLEEFERIGLSRAELLDYLQFRVAKNNKGESVIQISSSERITEPYLQILVDLAWANGQLYRSYTVLLDPPNYKLDFTQQPVSQPAPAKHYYANEPGVIEKPVYTQVVNTNTNTLQREEATYGPTLANESIWQIAQRYSTLGVSMPQIILAIVGTNSQAFTQGNLNGLKAGERLAIPATKEIMKVPAELAKQEVDAHDVAWNTDQQIKHVLLPPYIEGEKGYSQFGNNDSNHQETLLSELPKTPVLIQDDKPIVIIKDEITPVSYVPSIASIPVALPMINPKEFEQISHENALLKKEIDQLKADKQAAIKNTMVPKASVPVISPQEPEKTGFWWYPALLAALAAGVGLGYRLTNKRENETPDTIEPIISATKAEPERQQSEPLIEELPQQLPEEPDMPESIPELIAIDDSDYQLVDSLKEDAPVVDNYLLDFEPGLDKFIHSATADGSHDAAVAAETSISDGLQDFDDFDISSPQAPATTQELNKLSDDLALAISADLNLDNNQDDSYEFHHEAVTQEPSSKPVKSQTALDTLLALAKTYIAMEDFETARQSLQEVLDFGNETQQQAAQTLLDELNAR